MVSYNNPQWNADAATQYGLSSGLLKAGEQATGGLLIQRAQEAGRMGDLQSAMQAYTNPAANEGSFVPITVDPLHQYEQDALRRMANPPAYGSGSTAQANQYLQQLLSSTQRINPLAEQYMQQAGQFTTQAAAPITMADVEAIRNPYAQALQDRLTEQGRQARAALMSQQGLRGGRSFGDTSQGVRESYLDAELQRGRSDIDYKTYESALAQLQQQRQREQGVGGQLGQLGQAAQNLTQSGAQIGLNMAGSLFNAGQALTQQGRQATQDQLASGKYIRNYNQAINDMIANNILAGIADEPSRLANVQNLLSGFQSSTSTGPSTGANSLQQLGGLATAGGSLLDYFGSESARPSTGFVGPMQSNWGVMF